MKAFLKSIKEFACKYSEISFFVGMGIGFLSFTWLSWDEESLILINSIEKYRYLLAFFFIGLRLFSLFFINHKYALISSLILGLSLIPAYYTDSLYIMQMLVLIIGAYKIDLKKIIKVVLIFSVVTYIVALIGILTNNVSVIFDYPQGRTRCQLGFIHPSYFSIHFLTSLFCIWYLYLKEKKLLSFAALMLGAVFLWFVPNTRTSSFILLIAPFAYYIVKFLFNTNVKVFKYLFISTPFVFLILSIVLTFIVPDTMESTFAIRFQQARALLEVNGVHFFKCTLMWLDNQYMFLMQHFGIYTLLIYLYLFVNVNIKAIKEKNWLMLTISVLMLIYGMMDNYGLNPRYNISLFYLYSKSSENE